MLFRMVPKLGLGMGDVITSFRVMLFRMVPKPKTHKQWYLQRFRVMLFRMVPKRIYPKFTNPACFRV
ncbi:hypothetical protein, partial [Enterococcus faecalis]|uniref:hypothetical protein n=1 Tax=Enterococcus faecalis TaxID=1351 RepID=UPI0022E1A915